MNNFIAPDKFLEQPEEIKKVFMDWWQPQMYDLFFRHYGEGEFLKGNFISCIGDKETLDKFKTKKFAYPLLQIHHLISFIEENTRGQLDIISDTGYMRNYILAVYTNDDNDLDFEDLEFQDDESRELIAVLWDFAIEIAEGLCER